MKQQRMSEWKILLASQSPRRRELLTQAGFSYEVVPAVAEERTTKHLPWEIVLELSEQKAMEVYQRRAEDRLLVIGADTIVAYGDRILGKPESAEEAYEMLKLLQGNVHQVYTGVTIIWQKQGIRYQRSFYEKTEVTCYSMQEEEINAYIETGDCMDKAGAYGIQTQFGIYVKGIEGDYNNVVGLPIARLYQELKRQGIMES